MTSNSVKGYGNDSACELGADGDPCPAGRPGGSDNACAECLPEPPGVHIGVTGSPSYTWNKHHKCGDDVQGVLRRPVSEGGRLVIVHAGTKDAFVPGADLIFSTKLKKDQDYHGAMNSENFQKWVETQLIVGLKDIGSCVIVMDNASYHSKLVDHRPTTKWKKVQLVSWLRQNGVSPPENATKDELQRLCQMNPSRLKRYIVDETLRNEGHTVLRLPPYHSFFNAIELVWSVAKGHYNKTVASRPGHGLPRAEAVWKESLQKSYEGSTEDDLSALPSSEPEELSLVGDKGTSELLGADVDSVEFSNSQPRTGTLETEDGQILYATYTVNPCQELSAVSSSPPAPSEQQRMILYVGEDGSTYVLPAVDQASLSVVNEDVDSVFSLLPREKKTKGGQRRRTEQVIESELHIEDKLEVLDAMLTPLPEKARKVKKEARKRRKEDKEGEDEKEEYVCDLCGASFARAAQYYGHLHSHSGEWKWECTLCPTPVEFPSQSQLRRHEKQCHLNLRPHECSLCPARFDRASQLNYHERRIHAGERPHICQICHKGFFKRSDLRTHLNIHLGINKSICEICGKKFNHVSNLIRHTRMHSGIKPYPCTVCGKRFTQLNAMHQHKVSHQVEKDVSCGLCNKMFKSHAIMRKHVRHMHGDKEASNISSRTKEGGQTRRFYCKVCGESFEFAALLKEHERKHEQETSFHCQCCKQDFKSVDLLKTHSCQTPEERLQREAEAEAERLSLNSQLESLFQEQSGLMDDDGSLIIYVTQEGQAEPAQVHIKPLPTVPVKDVQEAPPPVNSSSVSDQDPLPEEMLLFENNAVTVPPESNSAILNLQVTPVYMPSSEDVSAPVSHEEERGETFLPSEEDLLLSQPAANSEKTAKDPLALTAAEQLKTEEDTLEEKVEDGKKRRVPRIYKCTECPKVFMKNSNYKQHLGTHFVDQMNYCCPMCGQFYAWKSTLNKHILRTHTTTKPPQCHCEICHREYASAGLVQDHIKRDHYKQRPHSCVVCKKTFYKKYDLTIHFRTHTKERPYICRTCGKRFYHLSHVIRHERIHSGHRPYKCVDCGKLFNQSSSLKSHRKRHTQSGAEKNSLEDLSMVEEVVQAVEFPMDEGNILLYTATL